MTYWSRVWFKKSVESPLSQFFIQKAIRKFDPISTLLQKTNITAMYMNPHQNTSNEEVFILIVNWNILKKYQD